MKKSLSICAFSVIMLLSASIEANARDGHRHGYGRGHGSHRPSRPSTRPHRTAPRRHVRPHVRPHRPSRPHVRPHRPSPRRWVRPYRPHRPAPGYRRYHHNPFRHNYVARRNYHRSSLYAAWLRSQRFNYFYRNWIMYPSLYGNGYWVIGGYPYYVYNGYQHRYSNYDRCDYQLVDRETDEAIRFYNDRICSLGYDDCARDRDDENYYAGTERFFCAERY